jgi:hypothetical protein
LSRRNLALALGIICAALLVIAALYSLITAAFEQVNPVATTAAIGVAVAGIAWFQKNGEQLLKLTLPFLGFFCHF